MANLVHQGILIEGPRNFDWLIKRVVYRLKIGWLGRSRRRPRHVRTGASAALPPQAPNASGTKRYPYYKATRPGCHWQPGLAFVRVRGDGGREYSAATQSTRS